MRMPRRLRSLPTDVYRIYDAAGTLLYVGTSANAFKRIPQHRSLSTWYDRAQTVRIEQYKDWRTARNVEGWIIASETPAGNWQAETASAMRYMKAESPTPIDVIEFDIADLSSARH
jgi:excinuclease UvrABC nuclease subunit